MKNEDPPFNPPYVSIHHAEDGVTYIKTLADGSAKSLSAAEAGWIQTGVSSSGPANAQSPKSSSKAHSQGKVFLNVPFAEKDAAKGLGARWDAARKKWYVPQGIDVDQFGQWMP